MPLMPRFTRLFCALLLCSVPLFPKVIGTNEAASPLTRERITSLPKEQQAVWFEYLQNSQAALLADQKSLAEEIKSAGLKGVLPAHKNTKSGITVDLAAPWYAKPEALHIADVILSYQTPSGGWSKNLNMSGEPRPKGGHFSSETDSKFSGPGENDDTPADGWSYVGSFDNGATILQLKFLARVLSSVDKDKNTRYQAAFIRGLDYLFKAQYPNGGFPQVWPLMGGYHDAITFNDDAMLNIIRFLKVVASGRDEYAWIPEPLRARARAVASKAIDCLLACQVRVDGRLTVWGQQHDMLTLAPCAARNYEMPSLCNKESAAIVHFLMQQERLSPAMLKAVDEAVAYYQRTVIRGKMFKNDGQGTGKHLIDNPDKNAPLWPRFSDLKTEKPVFGDRDKSIHDEVDEISKERRSGYTWYTDNPKSVLAHYVKWRKKQ